MLNDAADFKIGSVWRKRVAPATFELRRIEEISGRRIITSSHVGPRDFYDYEFVDLFAPLVSDASSISFAGSGHRPEHIVTGKRSVEEIRDKIFDFYVDLLRWLQPKEVISGLARGFDLWLAWAALETEVKLIGAAPYRDHHSAWEQQDQGEFNSIWLLCDEQHVVSPTYWQRDGDNALYARNRWMVDRCTHLTSFWQGTRGGTAWTNDYAIKCDKPRLVISSI